MFAYYQKFKITALLGLLLTVACNQSQDSWTTLANSLPAQVHTNQAFVSIVLYILKQTHEPILRKDDGENYSSHILSRWTRSLDYRNFTFCPNQSLWFHKGKNLSIPLFLEQLSTITKRYDAEATLSVNGECIDVKYKNSHLGYLDFLTKYENAPTVNQSADVEDGLGPFRVAELKKDRIVLARKVPARRAYNTIVLLQNPGEDKAKDLAVADPNLISGLKIPKSHDSAYQSFYNTELRTGDLIINHPDPVMRKMIYNCVDIDLLRRSFLPAVERFLDVATILPIGVPGAQQGLASQNCSAAMAAVRGKRGDIVFANWRTDNDSQMAEFAESFFKKTGVRMRLVRYPSAEFKKMLHSRPRPYHLTIMHLDAVVPDYQSFMETFFRKDGYLDFDLPKGEGYFEKMLLTEDPGRKRELALSAVSEISREAVALPLYQNARLFRYPRSVKNLVVGRGFIGYPEVADFRW